MQVSVGCGASLLPCRTDEEAFAARSDPSALRWSIEVAPLQLGAATRAGTGSARQGLNLSLVGKRPLFGSSFSVYGRLGTTYGATEPSGTLPAGLAAADNSYGKSFGAGVAMDFTPRLSATFGWDSRDLQLGSGQRDPVRATSMGLQYRY